MEESDTVRIPQLSRITQVQEWHNTVRNNFGSASGRPAKAYASLRVAEQPTTTYEDLQDSGDFE
eukprot:2985114-Pyramimonas_sp.AAC.1